MMEILLLGNILSLSLVILSLVLRSSSRGEEDEPGPIDSVRWLFRRHHLQSSKPNWLQKLLRVRQQEVAG